MNFLASNFIIQLFAFAILYYLLSRYAFKPLMQIMEQRRLQVQKDMLEAQQNRSESEQFLEEQKQALQEARKEAHEIVEQSKLTGSRQADKIINSAHEETTRLKQEAVREITAEKNKAVTQLNDEVAQLSVQIASKILDKEVDAAVQKKLVSDYLKKVGDS